VRADRWDVLVDAFTSPGMTTRTVRIYLARDVRPAEGARHEGEHEESDMPTRWVPLDDAVTAILQGLVAQPDGRHGCARDRRCSCRELRRRSRRARPVAADVAMAGSRAAIG